MNILTGLKGILKTVRGNRKLQRDANSRGHQILKRRQKWRFARLGSNPPPPTPTHTYIRDGAGEAAGICAGIEIIVFSITRIME